VSKKREQELLDLDPINMSDEELEEAIGDCNRITRQLQDDQSSAQKVGTHLGQRVSPIRQARNAFRQELKKRG
jgi:hypothetical protein